MADEIEERKKPGVARTYRNARIEVDWSPEFCIHVAACINSEPEVFDPMRRPWVEIDAASADRIAAAVMKCPTGALHFRRVDGGAQEPVPSETTVQSRRNGPLFVHGNLRFTNARGDVTRDDTRAALCRCGGSDNKPFCDGTHRINGFQAD